MTRNFAKLVGFLLISTVATACSQPSYQVLYAISSPDGRHVARMEFLQGSTLTDTVYRLLLVNSNEDSEVQILSGVEAYADRAVWTDNNTLLVPFCFGQVHAVQSVWLNRGGDTITKFRGRSSGNIRIHVVTAPDSVVQGVPICENQTSRTVVDAFKESAQ